MKHRLRYVTQQYKKHPIPASILGLILAAYIAILYNKVSR